MKKLSGQKTIEYELESIAVCALTELDVVDVMNKGVGLLALLKARVGSFGNMIFILDKQMNKILGKLRES
ncbi:MAG TPA: hypothetical protein PLU50_00190 [Pseudobdellovibrionaceae bacterium]|nr:hypothetical protein [Pseudobdellovibrionaceae bacterium]